MLKGLLALAGKLLLRLSADKPVNKKLLAAGFIIVPLVFAVSVVMAMRGTSIDVLQPAGRVASEERKLMFIAAFLAIFVVVPVYVMTVVFSLKYRAGNTKAAYRPDWAGSFKAEAVWWGLPLVLISILSVIVWNSTHALDPFKPLDHALPPMRVQVVALQWRWLFIYPEQQIATVNYVHRPTDRPIEFQATADAPMNSLWIPRLGGQIYAMSGMSTELNLIADRPGTFRGYSANLSGAGFANMTFMTTAEKHADFDGWVALTRQSPMRLDAQTYEALAAPNDDRRELAFGSIQSGLYDSVVSKFMSEAGHGHGGE
jgi:cytochrome o ubiquinol oxidase subunit 2